jgi:hypothetical protein
MQSGWEDDTDWSAGWDTQPKQDKASRRRPSWLPNLDPLERGPIRGHKDHLIDTPMKRGTCSRCRATVLEGLSSGCPLRLTPTPLTLEGEIQAVLAGLHTFALSTTRGWVYADWRSPFDISLDSKKGRPAFVLPVHRCEGS